MTTCVRVKILLLRRTIAINCHASPVTYHPFHVLKSPKYSTSEEYNNQQLYHHRNSAPVNSNPSKPRFQPPFPQQRTNPLSPLDTTNTLNHIHPLYLQDTPLTNKPPLTFQPPPPPALTPRAHPRPHPPLSSNTAIPSPHTLNPSRPPPHQHQPHTFPKTSRIFLRDSRTAKKRKKGKNKKLISKITKDIYKR